MIQHKQTYSYNYMKSGTVNNLKVCTEVACKAVKGHLVVLLKGFFFLMKFVHRQCTG